MSWQHKAVEGESDAAAEARVMTHRERNGSLQTGKTCASAVAIKCKQFGVPSAGSATIPFTRRDEVSPFVYN